MKPRQTALLTGLLAWFALHPHPARAAVQLSLVTGSTTKVAQVIGDKDRKTGTAILGQTATQYDVVGTDLGYPFEHQGKLHFLFGDTIGKAGTMEGDSFATTTTQSPTLGIDLDFVQRTDGTKRFQPALLLVHGRFDTHTQELGGFELPVAGVSVPMPIALPETPLSAMPPCPKPVELPKSLGPDNAGGPLGNAPPAMFVLMKRKKASAGAGGAGPFFSQLTMYDEKERAFAPVRMFSDEGHFIKVAFHYGTPPETQTLPTGTPNATPQSNHLYIWGTGPDHRHSFPYLAETPIDAFGTGSKTRYFGGLDQGAPVWVGCESQAVPLFKTPPVMGDISVTWSKDVGLWIMTYDSAPSRANGAPDGVLLRYARAPWGPWSEPILIFDPVRDGAYGSFIHEKGVNDGLDGPVINPNKNQGVGGGNYAPYVIERYYTRSGDRLEVYWLMSTWNPYVVVLMKTELTIVTGP